MGLLLLRGRTGLVTLALCMITLLLMAWSALDSDLGAELDAFARGKPSPYEPDPVHKPAVCALRAARGHAGETPLLDYACDHARLHRGVLILTVLNHGMHRFALNWLVSLHRAGIDNREPLILCVDQACYDEMRPRGVSVLLVTTAMWRELGWDAPPELSTSTTPTTPPQRGATVPPSPPLGEQVLQFNSDPYNQLMQVKVALPLYLLQHGFWVMFHDVDLVFVRRWPRNGVDFAIDTLVELGRRADGSMVFQDEYGFAERNFGFFVMRPALESRLVLALTLDEMRFRARLASREHKLRATVQPSMDNVLRGNNKALMWTAPMFNSLDYVTGSQIFCPEHLEYSTQKPNFDFADLLARGWDIPPDSPLLERLPYMIHGNSIHESKVDKLRAFKLWWGDDDAALRDAGLLPDGAEPAPRARIAVARPRVVHPSGAALVERLTWPKRDAWFGPQPWTGTPKADLARQMTLAPPTILRSPTAAMTSRVIDFDLCRFDNNFFDVDVWAQFPLNDTRVWQHAPAGQTIERAFAHVERAPASTHPAKNVTLANVRNTAWMYGKRLADLLRLPAPARPLIVVPALDYGQHEQRLRAHRPTRSVLRHISGVAADCVHLVSAPLTCVLNATMLAAAVPTLEKCSYDTALHTQRLRRHEYCGVTECCPATSGRADGWCAAAAALAGGGAAAAAMSNGEIEIPLGASAALREAEHVADAFTAPFVVVFRDSYSVGDGSVLNGDVWFKFASLGFYYKDTKYTPRAIGISGLDRRPVGAVEGVRHVRRVINVSSLPANAAFHILNNALFRLGLHVDELLRLFAAEDAAGRVDTVLHLGPVGPMRDTLKVYFDLLGFPTGTYERRVVDEDKVVHGDVVLQIAPPTGEMTAPCSQTLWAFRDRILAALGAPPRQDKLTLVIKRERKRFVRNHDALMAALRARFGPAGHEFAEVVDADFAPARLRDTLRRFASARAVIAPHGAGLVNIAFMPPGAHVYELLQEKRVILCFYSLATTLAHHYTGVLTPTDPPIAPHNDSDVDVSFDADVDDVVRWFDDSLGE